MHLPPQITLDASSKESLFLPNGRGNEAEKEALIQALKQANGNQSEAARILGINRVTVWNRMKKYGIELQKLMVS